MEQELPRRLLEYIFECGIDYHARRKFRQWCDCNYCQQRRILTANVSFGTRRLLFGTPSPLTGQCNCLDGCPNTICNREIPCYTKRPWLWDKGLGLDSLAPCDTLDGAIKNRVERVRETFRSRLRQVLTRLRNDHKFKVTLDENGDEIWKPRTLPPRRK